MNEMMHIIQAIKAEQEKGKKIVFTNGCFDILHRGHVTYLNQARDLGDLLIVGINSDESVKRLKGLERPVNMLEDRAYVLSALKSVDYVIPFEEDTPLDLINLIMPDILVKGGDYTIDRIVGAQDVLAHGGRVEIIPFVPGKSTSAIIDTIKTL
jgi:rfaE bifunctional protein nucleotidyltransferase chain/domain